VQRKEQFAFSKSLNSGKIIPIMNPIVELPNKMKRFIRNQETGEYLKKDGWTKQEIDAVHFGSISDAILAGKQFGFRVELVVKMNRHEPPITVPIASEWL
jgi:hypothetical protein